MAKNILFKRLGVAACLTSIVILQSTSAFARSGEDRSHIRGREAVVSGHERYHYSDGRFYRSGWFGFGIAVSALTIGALIESLPPRHTTVIVEGTPYYHDDIYYYRQVPEGGYVVVPQPVIIQPQIQTPGVTTTINVPNSNGSYTPVTLVKRNNGFVGPQGEYYPGNPTVEQLRALYGK